MRASLLLGVLLCVASLCVPAAAQNVSSTGEIHTRIQGIQIPAIPNAPFTARIVVTWDQPLAAGGTLSRKYFTMVARDSKGRVRRETRGFVSADSAAEPPLESVTIMDPAARRRTVCRQSTMVCTRSSFHSRTVLSPNLAAANLKGANLGTRTLEGVMVQGIRKTAPAYDGSRTVQTDLWYSPDLGIDMLVNRRSPTTGTVTLTVKDLKRGEPAKSMFGVPSGFRVVRVHGR